MEPMEVWPNLTVLPGTGSQAKWWALEECGWGRVAWLWPGRVPLGKLTLLVGDPGRGKSLLALDMAARVTRGAAWPDGRGHAPAGSVVLLSAEDDAADTLLPRLDAAGGDPERVICLQALQRLGDGSDDVFSLSRDLPHLHAQVQVRGDVRLIVLDPLTAYLGAGESFRNADIRRLLAPLQAMAQQTGVAVVGINHLTKRAAAAAIYRALGSIAFVSAARAVWATVADPQTPGRTLLLPVKCNLSRHLTGLAYTIEPHPANPEVPTLRWGAEPVDVSVDDALAAGRGPSPRERAAGWLAAQLADGPVPTNEIERRARAAGITHTALRAARQTLGVRAEREGLTHPWQMVLPGQQAYDAPDEPPASDEAAPWPDDNS